MILYHLVCAEEHEFDAWFRSGADFDSQSARGLVTCSVCGSPNVQRGLMAPNVVTVRLRAAAPSVDAPREEAPAPAQVPARLPIATPAAAVAVASLNPEQKAMLEAMIEMKRKITSSADYVGESFAEEARRIHYGEAPERGIYGETSLDEARALLDEGIEVHPLPVLPDERN